MDPSPPEHPGVGNHLRRKVLPGLRSGPGCLLARLPCPLPPQTFRLLHEIILSYADRSFPELLSALARVPLLILDDWLRDRLSASQARDLLEIVDDRYGRASTLVATQVPVEDWHVRFPDPTLRDAILDRLAHTILAQGNAYRLELKGGSMRKANSPLAAVRS